MPRNIDADHLKKVFDYACGTQGSRDMFTIAGAVYDFIIKTIDEEPTSKEYPDFSIYNINELSDTYICGYRMKDLIVLGKLFHDNGITREQLIDSSESFLAGYRKAYEEINDAIKKTVNSIGSKETDTITELFGVNGEEFVVSGGVIMPKKEN